MRHRTVPTALLLAIAACVDLRIPAPLGQGDGGQDTQDEREGLADTRSEPAAERSGPDGPVEVSAAEGGAERGPEAARRPEALLVRAADVTSDAEIKARLEAHGLAVVQVVDTASTTADADGKVLVFISESIGSSNVAAKFRDVAVPVIVSEASVRDDMKMTGPTLMTDYGWNTRQTRVAIISPAHALAAGLTGMPTVYISGAADLVIWGAPAASAIKIATVVGVPDQIAIFAYPAGAAMVGMNAPARRIAFFAPSTRTTTMVLNAEGQRLLDAAITWALSPTNS